MMQKTTGYIKICQLIFQLWIVLLFIPFPGTKEKKLNRTENKKKKKTHEVLNIQKKTQIQAKRKKGKQMRS